MKSEKPNLFDYATSELSQDAVICWMLDWINYEESEMKSFALNAIDRILKLHNYNNLNTRDIRKAFIKRQYRNIDILVKIYFNNNDVLYLIIEDKMNSVVHSEQLKRYSEIVKDLANNQENSIGLIGIYYKSGFIFDDEKEYVELNNYKVFDKVMMIKLMDEHKNKIANDIFNDYYRYLKLLKEREEMFDKAIDENELSKIEEILESPEGQWILASKIIKKIHNVQELYNGTNQGGTPWTQFSINKSLKNNNLPDKVFYRIDKRKAGYYIALRQYLNLDKKECKEFFITDDDTEILKHKKERLVRLRSCFTNAVAKLRNLDYYIEPGKTSNRGEKESEIGVFFVNQDNDFKKILKFIPEFNEIFCSELKKEFDKALFTQN